MQSDEELIQSLPGDLRRIALAAGIDAAVKIARTFRGSTLYVPGLDELERLMRDDTIRREFERGVPARKIALKHGISLRGLRKVLSRPPGQISPLLSRLLGLPSKGG